ncbi:DNA-binding response OmpR family regulator [Aequitasia blattaphilus]|uniref:Stage 0 sporulation protein A homolog n=1 Tax=Aequitasia blattaphilus TaxID=2949332 RepID=A0ABT1E9B6_9FIRM|nr:response regulator transcription factor [Aequitasia blattaphilus]MCP1102378.1 response regulator transcription factor [Aequitasia blattaphilus]MCR8615018.1 response regulator transcription factor [Aequitasia blattaphilus]
MANRVLIVDDDPAIRKLLEKVMQSNDLSCTLAENGATALTMLKNHTFDIVLLDISLGDMEGFEIIQHMRAQGITTPVMVISGRNEDFDSLYGLSLGADDYITKPFRPVVVGAKVKAILRRNKQLEEEQKTVIERGEFTLDTTTMRFYKNGEEIILSYKESALFSMFLHHPNQIFTKDMIYEQIWGTDVAVDDNAIMVYINRLRGKIEDDSKKPTHIVTVRGIGYRFIP